MESRLYSIDITPAYLEKLNSGKNFLAKGNTVLAKECFLEALERTSRDEKCIIHYQLKPLPYSQCSNPAD